MKSKEKLWEICMQVYRQMYKEAEPSADFDQLMKDGVTAKQGWFLDYHLSEERQVDIVAEICADHHLTKYERNKISLEVFLGSAPSCIPRGKDEG